MCSLTMKHMMSTLLPVLANGGRPGPNHPKYGISPKHWPMIMQRVLGNKERLRTVAQEYGVSREMIRRIILRIQKQGGQQKLSSI